MLESIVEQNHVEVGLQLFQSLDTASAIGIDGYRDAGEFPFYLVRLVAYFAGGRRGVGQYEAPALAFVAPAEHGHPVFGLQQLD